MSIIKEIMDKVRCPQLGSKDYGEWGALRLDQRIKIQHLCEYAESLEKQVDKSVQSTHKVKQLEHKMQNILEYIDSVEDSIGQKQVWLESIRDIIE